MCGGSDSATRQASAAEEERKRQVRQATAAIESAFGSKSRQQQLDDFIAALRGEFTADARQQKERTDRRAKFNLARSGLTGGSAAADLKVRIGDEYQKGLLKSERLAQGSLSDLIAADERSKQNLISLAQGGADVSTAARNAASALQSNLKGAQASSLVNDLGDIFADTRGVLTNAELAAERRRGLRESQVYADPFSRGS